jgi:uncharacterized membrane protein
MLDAAPVRSCAGALDEPLGEATAQCRHPVLIGLVYFRTWAALTTVTIGEKSWLMIWISLLGWFARALPT